MTYLVDGIVQASDYNNYATLVNAIWDNDTVPGPVTPTVGYGQSTVLGNTIAIGSIIVDTDWSNLINRMSNIAIHQGTTLTGPTPMPAVGGTIIAFDGSAARANLTVNYNALYTNRLNAATVGANISDSESYLGVWSYTTFTTDITYAFTSLDEAKYFFNAGGTVVLSAERTGGTVTASNTSLTDLFTDVSELAVPATQTAQTIVGVAYTGLTKLAGAGVPSIYIRDGYQQLTTTPVLSFRQASTAVGYTSDTLSVTLSSTGTVVTATVVITNGSASTYDGVLTVTGTAVQPETTVLTNSWGTPVVTVGPLVGAGGVACITPTAGAVSVTAATVGTAYSGTFTVNNATAATVTSKPAWMTVSVAGAVVTMTGTPDASAATFTITVSADNVCGGGLTPVVGSAVTSPAVTVTCQDSTITTALSPTGATLGVAYTATIVLANATAATVTNLPAGLTQSFAGSTITITGTPTAIATTALTVDATNACGATQSSTTALAGGTLTVSAAGVCPTPSAGALTLTTVTVGTAYSGTFTVNNATAVTVTSKPAWMTVTVAGAVVTMTGTPTAAAATFTITVSADNVCGGGNTSVLGTSVTSAAVTVNCQTPTVTATITPTPTGVNVAYSGTITVANATTATVTNLPTGLTQSFAGSTITITGTPTVAAATALLVNATNACGATSKSVTGVAGGTLTVGTICPTPTIGTGPATSPTVGTAYNSFFNVNNATAITITSKPAWMTIVISFTGTTGKITMTGTPTATASPFNVSFTANNVCAGGIAVTGTALSKSITLTCATPTIVTTVSPITGSVGTAFSGTIVTSNATAATVTNLPTGMTQSFSAATQTITLAGTPTAITTGALALLVNLTNACGSTTSTAGAQAGGSLTINGPCPTPTVNTQPASPMTVGTAYSSSFKLNNVTAGSTITVTSKPAWMTIGVITWVGTTATIPLTGTPDASAASWTITVSADNVCGGGNTTTNASITSASRIVNCKTPTIATTVSPTTAIRNAAYSGTITVANATSATVTNLPTGLTQSFAGSTITLAGTPTVNAVTALLVTITNACGATTATVTGAAGGSLTVADQCPTPTVNAQPTLTATVGIAYSSTFKISNVTSVTVTSKPAWMTIGAITYAAGVATIPLTGTPTTTVASFTIDVSADNVCGGGKISVIGAALSSSVVNVKCRTPSMAPLLAFRVGTPIAAGTVITVNFCTAVTVTAKPAWMTIGAITYAAGNATIPISGTPDASTGTTASVDASADNVCSALPGMAVTGATLTQTTFVNCAFTGSGNISPTTATRGVPYTGTITTTNCTSASVQILPDGLTQSFSVATQTITITGTPSATATTRALLVDRRNDCGATPAIQTAAAAGTLTVV